MKLVVCAVVFVTLWHWTISVPPICADGTCPVQQKGSIGLLPNNSEATKNNTKRNVFVNFANTMKNATRNFARKLHMIHKRQESNLKPPSDSPACTKPNCKSKRDANSTLHEQKSDVNVTKISQTNNSDHSVPASNNKEIRSLPPIHDVAAPFLNQTQISQGTSGENDRIERDIFSEQVDTATKMTNVATEKLENLPNISDVNNTLDSSANSTPKAEQTVLIDASGIVWYKINDNATSENSTEEKSDVQSTTTATESASTINHEHVSNEKPKLLEVQEGGSPRDIRGTDVESRIAPLVDPTTTNSTENMTILIHIEEVNAGRPLISENVTIIPKNTSKENTPEIEAPLKTVTNTPQPSVAPEIVMANKTLPRQDSTDAQNSSLKLPIDEVPQVPAPNQNAVVNSTIAASTTQSTTKATTPMIGPTERSKRGVRKRLRGTWRPQTSKFSQRYHYALDHMHHHKRDTRDIKESSTKSSGNADTRNISAEMVQVATGRKLLSVLKIEDPEKEDIDKVKTEPLLRMINVNGEQHQVSVGSVEDGNATGDDHIRCACALFFEGTDEHKSPIISEFMLEPINLHNAVNYEEMLCSRVCTKASDAYFNENKLVFCTKIKNFHHRLQTMVPIKHDCKEDDNKQTILCQVIPEKDSTSSSWEHPPWEYIISYMHIIFIDVLVCMTSIGVVCLYLMCFVGHRTDKCGSRLTIPLYARSATASATYTLKK